jgi:two-component system NtrC family sensor kinase
VLGVIDVSLDLAQIDKEMGSIQVRVGIITATLVILMSAFIFYFTKHFVSGPIDELIEGTKAVSEMQLDTPITIKSSEELGELAQSFDSMRLQLKGALEENERFTQSLETKVEERTEQLKIAHQKLLHSDRLASLGQLSASVAHEINNPLSGVLNLSMLMQRIVKDDGIPSGRVREFKKYLSQVVNETTRVGRIVQDLLAFSRRSKPQRTMTNLNSVIATTVNLLSHKLKLMNVSVELALDNSAPSLRCDSSQMQQVLINLIMNGAEAAQGKEGGKVIVRTGVQLGELVLDIKDNGDGIPAEHIERIFDPFFTTKGEGKGVGLGLAVVYGIIEGHKGDIQVTSKVGEGATFIVRLPLEPETNQEPSTTSEPGHGV